MLRPDSTGIAVSRVRIGATIALLGALVALGLAPAPAPAAAAYRTIAGTTATVAPGHVNGTWLFGANMPWLNWGVDFGGKYRGVHANLPALDQKLAAAQAAGMHDIRWWVFEGGAPQINRDAGGTPTSLNPAVYADFDAALTEAGRYGISYTFVLFASTNEGAVTHQWWENSQKRQALVAVLTPLFAHYASNLHVHTWEIVNEPDWQTRNGQTTVAGATATVDLLADAIHASSKALVTVGEAQLQDMKTWVGHHLDYHSPHYYNNFGTGANDPFVTLSASPDGKPVVIGEFPANSGATPSALQRWQDLYANGYAGGWAWSLSPEHTYDKLSVDMTAAITFSQAHTDMGPLVP